MTATVVFVDVETTGLDPQRADVWEIAVIEDGGAGYLWRVKPDLTVADPGALRVNQFYERAGRGIEWEDPRLVAADVAHITAGKILAGAVPSFDAAFLDVFLRRNGQCPAWSHRTLCVETYAAGRLGASLPVSLSDTAAALGVPLPDGRHSALVDARLARDVYLACRFVDAEIVEADSATAPASTAGTTY